MSAAAAFTAAGMAVLSVCTAGICLHLRRAAARYAHEVRAALASACILLESSVGLEPGQGLSFEQRSRIALTEMQRANRLMGSLEELAGRSLASHGMRRIAAVVAHVKRRRMARAGSFDPYEEAVALVHVWRLIARSSGRIVRLEWNADRRAVLGRRDHFVQALSNLLGNALRHGAGDVLVRADANSSHLRLSVTDDGPGLPMPLTRLVRGRTRDRHGHGLPVAHTAIRRLGGKLRSVPAPHGARLLIELPLERDLVGDGSSDWYTAARASLAELDREQRGARVIPIRRGAGAKSGGDTARGSRAREPRG